MLNLKILIVEDSPVFATKLELLVRSMGYLPMGIIDNSEEALQTINSEEPDLILMDIDIDGELSGIEVAEKTNHLEIPVIFITSFGDHELYKRAKKLKAHVNFLVKPLNEITLRSTIENTLRNLSAHISGKTKEILEDEDFILNKSIFFKKNNALVKVPIHSIIHAESDGNYSRVYSKEHGSFIIKKSSSKISLVLPSSQFIRVHRKYIINADYVEKIELSHNEIFVHGLSLPIGRKHKESLLNRLKKLS